MHKNIKDAELEIIRAFNSNPKQGIKRITEISKQAGISPVEAIAEFFHVHKNNLDLESVGDYLGSANRKGAEDINEEVLKAFAQTMEFRGKSLIESLRVFFRQFQIPKEGQKLGRLIKCLSDTYFTQNPEGNIKHQDAAFILAYQIIMLNTDLHNQNLKDSAKMSLDQLIRNLRGVNDSGSSENKDFDRELLEAIYNEIKSNPIEFTFAKTTPGYVLTSPTFDDDPMFKSLDSILKSSEDAPQNVIQSFGKNIQITVQQEKSWLNVLTGYEGAVSITDADTKVEAIVQVYIPGLFSKFFFDEQPRIIVQPVYKNVQNEQAQQQTIDLAAKIAAKFSLPPKSIEATYDYQKDELLSSYKQQKTLDTVEKAQAFKSRLKNEAGSHEVDDKDLHNRSP